MLSEGKVIYLWHTDPLQPLSPSYSSPTDFSLGWTNSPPTLFLDPILLTLPIWQFKIQPNIYIYIPCLRWIKAIRNGLIVFPKYMFSNFYNTFDILLQFLLCCYFSTLVFQNIFMLILLLICPCWTWVQPLVWNSTDNPSWFHKSTPVLICERRHMVVHTTLVLCVAGHLPFSVPLLLLPMPFPPEKYWARTRLYVWKKSSTHASSTNTWTARLYFHFHVAGRLIAMCVLKSAPPCNLASVLVEKKNHYMCI